MSIGDLQAFGLRKLRAMLHSNRPIRMLPLADISPALMKKFSGAMKRLAGPGQWLSSLGESAS